MNPFDMYVQRSSTAVVCNSILNCPTFKPQHTRIAFEMFLSDGGKKARTALESVTEFLLTLTSKL